MINASGNNSINATGCLFVISGPSGVGKGTLVAAVRELLPDIAVSISATTRPMRKGEKDGVEYFFVDDKRFDELIECGDMLEWACVHDKRYGTLASEVRKALDEGRSLILEIDPQGNEQVKRMIPGAYSIFIAPPSFDALKERIKARNTEDDDAIEQRLRTAKLELAQKDSYNVVLVNDNLQESISELVQIINEQRSKGCSE